MRPVTLDLSQIKDPAVKAALTEIQRASIDTLQNDTSSSGAAMSTLIGAAADEIAYFTGPTTTAFTALTAYARTLLASVSAAVGFGLSASGATVSINTANPPYGFDMPVNLQLNASVGSNILTIAVKAANGGVDASASNPVLFPFRDTATSPGAGGPVWRSLTGALSISTVVGASFGVAANNPFRLWVLAFDNGGTVVLALFESVNGIGIAGGANVSGFIPLNRATLQSTIAMTSGSATNGTFYTPAGVTLTSKAYCILGYVDFNSGLATPGSYSAAPDVVQLFGPGIPLPGQPTGKIVSATTTSAVSNSSAAGVFGSSNLTASIALSAAPNLVRVKSNTSIYVSAATGNWGLGQMFRGSNGLGVIQAGPFVASGTYMGGVNTSDLDAPGTTASTTYTFKFANGGAGGTVISPATNTNSWGAGTGARIELEELSA